jgi:predicted amidohydrolase YtcJ
MTTPSTLYRDGRVYSAADPQATALLVRDGAIAWLGATADAPAADVTIDLEGALVTPAFVDAHIHATDTGIVLLGLDLAGTRSAADVLDRLATHAAALPADAIVVGHGWDESAWPEQTPPSAAELDRAGGGRSVYLSQVSVHSAVVSTALLDRAPISTPGWDGGGWLRRDAHHVVREIAMGSIPASQRAVAQRAALRRFTNAAAPGHRPRTISPASWRSAGKRTCPMCTASGANSSVPPRLASWAPSEPAATCTPTARSAPRPRTSAAPIWIMPSPAAATVM